VAAVITASRDLEVKLAVAALEDTVSGDRLRCVDKLWAWPDAAATQRGTALLD